MKAFKNAAEMLEAGFNDAEVKMAKKLAKTDEKNLFKDCTKEQQETFLSAAKVELNKPKPEKKSKTSLDTLLKEVMANPLSRIRAFTRGAYDIQKLRVSMQLRIGAAWRKNMGLESSQPEEENKMAEKIFKELRKNYDTIMEGMLELPSAKKFMSENLATGLIKDYSDLLLMSHFFELEKAEKQILEKDLKVILQDFPIYTQFMEQIEGIGPAIAAIIISEIDIHKATYASSLHMYCGVDVVVDQDGFGEGRSRKNHHLVERTYLDKEGATKTRMGLSHKPFIKTKLVGVLGGSFLKCSKTIVDGSVMFAKVRFEYAKSKGFVYTGKPINDLSKFEEEALKKEVIKYLQSVGVSVFVKHSKYGKIYHEYKQRITQTNEINKPIYEKLKAEFDIMVKQHDVLVADPKAINGDIIEMDKKLGAMQLLMKEHPYRTDGHLHNMANRYAVKRFLIDLYYVWRTLEGLPVTEEYAVRKLGLHHNQENVPVPELVKRLIKNPIFNNETIKPALITMPTDKDLKKMHKRLMAYDLLGMTIPNGTHVQISA